MISRAKTEIWQRILTNYLPLYYPEAGRFRGNSRSDWFLTFLERFPAAGMVSALSKENFVAADLLDRGATISLLQNERNLLLRKPRLLLPHLLALPAKA